MASSISEYVAQCLHDFQVTLKPPSAHDMEYKNLLDEFARFKLWTGNIGAHKKGRSSLDWRLRDSSHLRDLVVNLLTEMKSALQELLSISNKILNVENNTAKNLLSPDSPETSDDTDVLEIIEEIADIIGCLLRLSVSIKHPAPHDHFMSSNSIDTSHFEKYDVEHVKTKLDKIEDTLALRLGKAISKRRQYFKYRESHHEKLCAGLDLDPTRSETGVQSTVASSIPTAFKDNTSGIPTFSLLDEESSNSGASQTSYATSGPESGRLKMPPLPKQADDGPFECPFCYMMISVSNTIQWRKHVNDDLRPYICLELDCLTPERLYAKRHEWLQHIKQKHWRTFRCPYSCKAPDFTSPSHFEDHIRQSHPGLSSHEDLSTILSLCGRPGAWSMQECQLCQDPLRSEREYARHIGRHQTELALFALPNKGEDSDEEDNERDSLDHTQIDGEFPIEDSSDSENSDTRKAEFEAEREAEAERVKREAEELARRRREAYDKLEDGREEEAERMKREAEEFSRLGREARDRLEAERKAEQEIRKKSDAAVKAKLAFLKAEEDAKMEATKNAAEDVEWRSNLEAEAKLEAEIEARRKIEN